MQKYVQRAEKGEKSMILETNDRVETCSSFGSRDGFLRRSVTKAGLKT